MTNFQTGPRAARVSDADMALFKAEVPAIRKALKAIKWDRWNQSARKGDNQRLIGQRPMSADQLNAMKQRLTPIRERLRYWQTILQADAKHVRHPVALWDTWHKLRDKVDFEDGEIEYLADREGLPAMPRTYVDASWEQIIAAKNALAYTQPPVSPP
jgi:hypothetical protein